MSENACKVESTVGASTTDTAFCRSSKLENAADLRSAQGSLRVGSIPTSGIVPVEHGWFMHRPCKSGSPDSNSGTGLSAEGKLRGGHTTLPETLCKVVACTSLRLTTMAVSATRCCRNVKASLINGRGCGNQTKWAYGVMNHPEPLLTVRSWFESEYVRDGSLAKSGYGVPLITGRFTSSNLVRPIW